MTPLLATVNIQRATAWTSGHVIFEGESLSSVVRRVNRYGNTRIEIEDAQVVGMKSSGVFNAGYIAGVVDIATHICPCGP